MNNKEKTAQLYKDIYKNTDRLTNYCLAVFFVFGVGISFYYKTFSVAFINGSICLAVYYSFKIIFKEGTIHQYLLSIIYGIFAAQFLYQMHGKPEMYFTLFVAALLLISYQNWRLHFTLALVTIIHHILFAYLQNAGKEIYFSETARVVLSDFIMNLFFTITLFSLAGYWSYVFEKRNVESYLKGIELTDQLSSVNVNIAFADEISQGNLDVRYELEQGDILGESLLKMRENLQAAYKKDQEDKFVNIGLAKASEILRVENNNLESLCSGILNFLIKYLEVNQGGLFVLNDNDASTVTLELKACYAYNRKKFLEKTIEPGEGLVGQAYVEKETIYLTEVPEHYVSITSGLGESNPKCIVIVPLKINEMIFGIIEIASFTILEKYRVDFIEKIGESIATSISNAKVNEKTQKLLQESQQQAEMLRSQEEEMRQNMEELAATQEEMERKAMEMDQIREEEKNRNDVLIENQKKMMDQSFSKFRANEEVLKDKITKLESELEKYKVDKNIHL
jgi:methyl-accepting chemotaxis protein